MQVHKLSLYLRQNNELLEIESKLDTNKELLLKEARDRKRLNSLYFATLVTYSAKEATVVV